MSPPGDATSAHRARSATLVRHAHAEWPAYQGRDFDRPLTARGIADAGATATAIAALLPAPTLIIASAAHRTTQTAEIIARSMPPPGVAMIRDETLYNASGATLQQVVMQALQDHDHVLLVAHNPGISELARQLLGSLLQPVFAPAEWRRIAMPVREPIEG